MIEIVERKLLSDNWYKLERWKFRMESDGANGPISTREVYDRGNGAGVLLFHGDRQELILTRQFRLPAYLNGHSGGLLEVAAGLVDTESPEECMIRECVEETGYRPQNNQKAFELFMSPGSVTEILHLFYAQVSEADHVSTGGGAKDEDETIELVYLTPETAWNMVQKNEISDAKTVVLLQWFMMNIWYSGGD